MRVYVCVCVCVCVCCVLCVCGCVCIYIRVSVAWPVGTASLHPPRSLSVCCCVFLLQCNVARKKEMRMAKAAKSVPHHEQNLTLLELQAAGAHVQRTLDGLMAAFHSAGRPLLLLSEARRFQRCARVRVGVGVRACVCACVCVVRVLSST